MTVRNPRNSYRGLYYPSSEGTRRQWAVQEDGVTQVRSLQRDCTFPYPIGAPRWPSPTANQRARGPIQVHLGRYGEGRKGVGKLWSDPTEDMCDCSRPPQSWAPTKQDCTYRQKTEMLHTERSTVTGKD